MLGLRHGTFAGSLKALQRFLPSGGSVLPWTDGKIVIKSVIPLVAGWDSVSVAQ